MASLQSAYKHSSLLLPLSGSALKVIAVISMMIDHSAYYLMEHETLLYEVMRCFGRIAFQCSPSSSQRVSGIPETG